MNGDTVAYVVTRNIQYTNVCSSNAASARSPRASSPRTSAGLPISCRSRRSCGARGGVGARRRGGLPPGRHPPGVRRRLLPLDRAGHQGRGARHSRARLLRARAWQGAATLGLPLGEYLGRLRDEGLSSLPGTAAEVLGDEVRRVICPDKVTTDQWLEVHDTAHRLGLGSNNTIMFGHVDGPVNWARHLLARARATARDAAASRSSSRCRSCTWRRRCI